MKKMIADLHKKLPYLDAVVNMIIGAFMGGCAGVIIQNVSTNITPFVPYPVIIVSIVCIGIAILYNKYLGRYASLDLVAWSMQHRVSDIIESGNVEEAKNMKTIIDTLGLPSMRDVMSIKSEETNQDINPRDGIERQG